MNLLLFGATGLVGRAIVAAAPASWNIAAPTSQECDIGNDGAVRAVFAQQKPSLVINAAGFTRVDAAQDDRALAERANVQGPAHIAAASREIGARFIHLSSDYVFDGHATHPYAEDAPARALSAYGQTKLDGERAVFAAHPGALVVRSQWIFGAGGQSLVATMRSRAERGLSARVVNDQRGRPTYASDLADALVEIAQRPDVTGLLHVANEGDATPFDIAAAVYAQFGQEQLVQPVSSAEFGARAVRPVYSVLSLARLHSLGVEPRHWRAALGAFLNA